MAYSETRFVPAPVWRAAWVAPAVFAAVAVGAFGLATLYPSPQPMAASSVKVQMADGHGSGVHIGDGLILSAEHVVRDAEIVQLKLTDGTTRDATVLWVNPESDVALLQTAPDGLAASPLNCAPPVVGEVVTVTGNPLFLEFVTTRGHIAGGASQVQDWASVATVDMTILPGMSGAGSINERNEVVGLAIAFLSIPIGFSASATGLGMIVDAEHICGLMGRT